MVTRYLPDERRNQDAQTKGAALGALIKRIEMLVGACPGAED